MNLIPEFGIKRENEVRRDGGCAFVFDPQTQEFAVGEHTDGGLLRLFSGGVDEGEDIREGILREVVEESGLNDFTYVEQIAEAMAHFYAPLKKVNRVAKATCLLVILKSRRAIPVVLEAHETFNLAWATKDQILQNWKERNKDHDLDHWLYFFDRAQERLKELNHQV